MAQVWPLLDAAKEISSRSQFQGGFVTTWNLRARKRPLLKKTPSPLQARHCQQTRLDRNSEPRIRAAGMAQTGPCRDDTSEPTVKR